MIEDIEVEESAEYEDAATAKAKARQAGLEILEATNHDLFLDLDTPEQIAHFKVQFEFFKTKFKVVRLEAWRSKSGHSHVWLTLKEDLSFIVRVGLQAALGSDPKREIFSIWELDKSKGGKSYLFRPKSSLSLEEL